MRPTIKIALKTPQRVQDCKLHGNEDFCFIPDAHKPANSVWHILGVQYLFNE